MKKIVKKLNFFKKIVKKTLQSIFFCVIIYT
ncbi:hypothetical protein BPSP16_04555 [Brachyspira pilosicoli SP16]|nr:hypothetical protein BPSP16_04555 [Brachyspira pilosicoli SP16]